MFRTGVGEDSHRFLTSESAKPCVIGGVTFEDTPGLQANSDGDVVYHAICNAISSLTGVLILGGIADDLCLKDGITDSAVYLERAVQTLSGQKVVHVAISLEGKRPHFSKQINRMRSNVARIIGIEIEQVGITATSGEGLTSFGLGDGVRCLVILSLSG